ncbi:MAG: hypothetical protein ACD_20C00346G0003 [uncultured bacterium]|nr:MAG: hypothetical protein ACD_20C00346G0003 [uncultured bacterium]HBH18450.1 type III polyketide synthase [Cyanobacteria bacterium UBA9579]
MISKIISTSTATPEYRYNSGEIIEHIKKWVKNQPESYQKKVVKIFEGAQIDQKYSILPIEKIFSPMTFEEKNNHYINAVIDLGAKVLDDALKKADLEAKDIDYIITTSCTGYMIPSFDAYLINGFNFKQDIQRLPVTEMGCAGGAAGLIYADHFLKAYPYKNVAVISVEIPSITFQYNDFSIDNVVGSAVFADGAACAILGPTTKFAPEIIDTQMHHFSNTTDILGFNLTNSGFKVVLSEKVPDKIIEYFENTMVPFLARNNLAIKDVNNLIFHPGGKRITLMIQDFMNEFGKELTESKEIMRLYGNMSSATVLFILDRFLNKNIRPDDYGLILGFGPGFAAQSLLLRWH